MLAWPSFSFLHGVGVALLRPQEGRKKEGDGSATQEVTKQERRDPKEERWERQHHSQHHTKEGGGLGVNFPVWGQGGPFFLVLGLPLLLGVGCCLPCLVLGLPLILRPTWSLFALKTEMWQMDVVQTMILATVSSSKVHRVSCWTSPSFWNTGLNLGDRLRLLNAVLFLEALRATICVSQTVVFPVPARRIVLASRVRLSCQRQS